MTDNAIKIVKGNPTPKELAALTAVLSVMAATDLARAPRPKNMWMRHEYEGLRNPYGEGPRELHSNMHLPS